MNCTRLNISEDDDGVINTDEELMEICQLFTSMFRKMCKRREKTGSNYAMHSVFEKKKRATLFTEER